MYFEKALLSIIRITQICFSYPCMYIYIDGDVENKAYFDALYLRRRAYGYKVLGILIQRDYY